MTKVPTANDTHQSLSAHTQTGPLRRTATNFPITSLASTSTLVILPTQCPNKLELDNVELRGSNIQSAKDTPLQITENAATTESATLKIFTISQIFNSQNSVNCCRPTKGCTSSEDLRQICLEPALRYHLKNQGPLADASHNLLHHDLTNTFGHSMF